MIVRIPWDKNFNYKETKKMYDKYSKLLNEEATFEEVIKNTFFYAFYDKNVLSFCVYFFYIGDKLWVNAFGVRKKYLFHKKCFKLALSWFNCDIWAESVQKPAILGMLSCGFKKYKGNVYKYSRCNVT